MPRILRKTRIVTGAFMNPRLSFVLLTSALATSALSSVASAADLPPASAPQPYVKAPMISPATNWSGFYGGVNVGYGWGNNDMFFANVVDQINLGSGVSPQSLGTGSTGAVGGGQIGYDWQVGTFVAGLEADLQGSGIRGTATKSPIAASFTLAPGETFIGTSQQKLSWFGTVRGRLGATVSPGLLLYGTGGLAYGHVSNSGNAADTDNGDVTSFPGATGQTKVGWAAGAGAEWMFARGWSAKVEYLHIDLGTTSVVGSELENGVPITSTPGHVAYTWHNSFDTVRAGVNYHFN